jgi:trigger factor
MKTELIDVSPTRKEIKIEIEPEAVRTAYDNVSRKYARGAQVAGFRKGNAPLDVVRLRYKEEIKQETLQELLAEKVAEAIRQHDLTPLVQPDLHLDDAENLKLNGSQPLVLHAHVEIMPEIPTPEYKGLEAVRRVKPLEDGEVERFIDERRREQASLIPVEGRKSRTGDTVIVDLEGAFENEPDAEPIRAEDLEIALGDASIEKSFTDNFTDVEADEEKEFTVTYEPNFSSPALAGKTVNYRAKIKSVGAVELPEADDEWVRSLGEDFESMDDLRAKLRADLEKHSTGSADAKVQNELITRLIENHAFEVPDALIESQSRNLLNNFAQDLQQRGVDLQKVEKEFIEMAYTQMRSQAERDVRGAMLLEKVAEMENIEVSGDEVAAEIERMAHYYRTTPEEIRKSLTEQGGEANIASNLRTRKAVDAIFKNARITDGEWIDESQATRETAEKKSTEKAEEEKASEDAPKEKKPKAEKNKPAAKSAAAASEETSSEPKPEKKAAAKKDKTA